MYSNHIITVCMSYYVLTFCHHLPNTVSFVRMKAYLFLYVCNQASWFWKMKIIVSENKLDFSTDFVDLDSE